MIIVQSILRCYRAGNELLPAGCEQKNLSVHDFDENQKPCSPINTKTLFNKRLISAGLVLMNSAGKIEPGWRAEELEAKNAFVPPRLLVELVSRGLFLCALPPNPVDDSAAERIWGGLWHGGRVQLTNSPGIGHLFCI